MFLDKLKENQAISGRTMIAVLLFIAIIAAYSWIIEPYSIYLSAAENFYSSTDDFVQKEKMLVKTVQVKEKELEELESELEERNKKFFTKKEAKEFFTTVQAASEKAGCSVQLTSFSPLNQPKGKTKKLERQDYILPAHTTLLIKGDFRSIVALTEELQNNKKEVWINFINIDSAKEKSSLLECDMVIAIYVLEDEETS
jgi:hypothetical protein